MTISTDTAMPALPLGEAGSDPIEDRLRETVRATSRRCSMRSWPLFLAISVLAAIGVRRDGQKVLLSIKHMGGRARRPGASSSTIYG
jgi:hypothetical protein